MLHIEIEIPRPFLILFLLVGIVWGISWANSEWVQSEAQKLTADAVGGMVESPEQVVLVAEEDAHSARVEQAILEQKEEILRYELRTLEEDFRRLRASMNPEVERQYRQGITELVSLMRDKQRAERVILESLRQIWEAQGRAIALGRTLPLREIIRLAWPLDPIYGVSANFLDPDYEERFGFSHKAVDIPIEQGTEVLAAADGVVEEVTDNGLGFNSVTIRHDGFVTLYGHVASFLVEEGQTVKAGDPIAYSGGMPGTAGAGHLSTGPHLHLEVILGGVQVDPLEYLPPMEVATN